MLKGGHLFLSLMADGGIYEFEPAAASPTGSFKSPVAFKGPRDLDLRAGRGGV